MRKRLDVNYPVQCPRCRTKKQSVLRRGSLLNQSTFLPEDQRGSIRSKRVVIRCLNCGYHWRSEANVDHLPEATREELDGKEGEIGIDRSNSSLFA